MGNRDIGSRQKKRALGAVVMSLLIAAFISPTLGQSPAPPRQINITADSQPGWLPTNEQEATVQKATMDFLAALDNGRLPQAYGAIAEAMRKQITIAMFTERESRISARAGPVKLRRITRVTWTKDAPRVPFPGVYAAVDLVSQFANIDRHCGFVVLHQPPSGGEFSVMRYEVNFLDNAMAQQIEAQGSREDVNRRWSELSRHCPGYVAANATGPRR